MNLSSPNFTSVLSLLLIAFALLTFFHCASRTQVRFVQREDIQRLPAEFAQSGARTEAPPDQRSPCFRYESYIPDTNHLEHTPVKFIRVNFHWVQPIDSVATFPEDEVATFSHGLLKAMNYALANNKKMWLPHRNTTPTLPIRIQYVFTPQADDPEDDGIYFHYTDEDCYYVAKGGDRNLYDRSLIERYGIQLDTILNFFFQSHHPDSIASPTYSAVGTGVALGNAVKMAGINFRGDYWAYRGVLNHEVGHIYGLRHTWAYNDGCDDTPRHRQDCWNRNQRPGCDTTTSNNLMDYNAMQLAWTPCQIAKVHQRMADLRARPRQLLAPNWCRSSEAQHIYIRDTITWSGAVDLEGPLTIEPGGQLTIQCRISLPPGSRIAVRAGGTLILDGARLHNACGQEWLGIEVQEVGGVQGRVQFLREPVLENMTYAVDLESG